MQYTNDLYTNVQTIYSQPSGINFRPDCRTLEQDLNNFMVNENTSTYWRKYRIENLRVIECFSILFFK